MGWKGKGSFSQKEPREHPCVCLTLLSPSSSFSCAPAHAVLWRCRRQLVTAGPYHSEGKNPPLQAQEWGQRGGRTHCFLPFSPSPSLSLFKLLAPGMGTVKVNRELKPKVFGWRTEKIAPRTWKYQGDDKGEIPNSDPLQLFTNSWDHPVSYACVAQPSNRCRDWICKTEHHPGPRLAQSGTHVGQAQRALQRLWTEMTVESQTQTVLWNLQPEPKWSITS